MIKRAKRCCLHPRSEMEKAKKTGNKDAAKLVGELIARKCKEKGIDAVVFDRGGYMYHGRVKGVGGSCPCRGLEILGGI